MRITTLLLSLCLHLCVDAQGRNYWHHVKRQATPAALWYTSGFFDGAADMMRDKYSVSIFPQQPGQKWLGKDRSYWNPGESWVRKYRDWPNDTRAAFPGAKTWAVSLTDGWHLAKTLHLKAAQAATVMYRPPQEIRHWQPVYVGQPPPTRVKPRWWWPLADAALMSLSFSAGWHTAEALIRTD